MKIVLLYPENWKELAEHAHSACFDTFRPKEKDRIDYTLLALDDDEKPLGYITVKEFDADTVYWQFGGAFIHLPPSQRFSVYTDAIEWTRKHYKRVLTRIENTNIVMLKFALKAGFLVQGVKHYQGTVNLECELIFKGET